MIIIIMKIWKNDVRVHKSYEHFNVRVHKIYERSNIRVHKSYECSNVRVHKIYERSNVRVHKSYERSRVFFFSFLSYGQKHKTRQETRQPQSRVGRPGLGAWHDEKGQ